MSVSLEEAHLSPQRDIRHESKMKSIPSVYFATPALSPCCRARRFPAGWRWRGGSCSSGSSGGLPLPRRCRSRPSSSGRWGQRWRGGMRLINPSVEMNCETFIYAEGAGEMCGSRITGPWTSATFCSHKSDFFLWYSVILQWIITVLKISTFLWQTHRKINRAFMVKSSAATERLWCRGPPICDVVLVCLILY